MPSILNADAPAVGVSSSGLGPWFPVGATKFVLMSIGSLGFYDLYWMYQNWRRFREASPGEDLSPFWRTFFAVFWIIPLLRAIRDTAVAVNVEASWNAQAAGVAFIVFNVAGRLPAPWSVLAFLSFLTLVPAVKTIEEINRAIGMPEGENSGYSVGNVAVIVFGGLLFLLAIVGVLFLQR